MHSAKLPRIPNLHSDIKGGYVPAGKKNQENLIKPILIQSIPYKNIA